MNITLIRPNMGEYRATDAFPPLAMGILAARAKRLGHTITFYDDRVEPLPHALNTDLLAMSVETFTARRAYHLAARYRAQGIPVVMGGYHPTLCPEEAQQQADAIVMGDAEGTWERLLADVEKRVLQPRYTNHNQASLEDHVLDRSIFAGKRYAPVEFLQFGRGCRFTCDFCSIHAFYGTRLRMRTPQDLVAEMQTLNPRRLHFFVDDNLFSRRATLEALLAALKPLKRRWSCQISIDVARDPKLLDALAEAGCRFVLIGFESLDRANLIQMKKPWNHVAGDYLKVCRALHARGIGIYGTFVFGYDHDTTDTVARSLEFGLEAQLEIANFNPLTPTPGSALYQRLTTENRLISPRWWLDPQYRYGDPIFRPARMSAETLTTQCFEAKTRFYAWSSIGRRLWKGGARHSLFSLSMSAIANLTSRREVYRKQGLELGMRPT